jgi:hypothetical protein
VKSDLSKIVENRYHSHRQADYLHYIAQIEEWPIPLKSLVEPFYAIIFWFVTSFIIPELINIART